MPTYQFDELWDARPASTSTTGGQSLTRRFECEVSDATVSGAQVIGALAAIMSVYKGSTHPNYVYALCYQIEADVHPEDPFKWILKADYREPLPVAGTAISPPPPPPPGSPPSPPTANPAPNDRAAKIGGTFRRMQKFLAEDLDDVKVVNTAGDPFDNPPPVEYGVPQFKVTRDYDAWNLAIGAGYFNKVNSDVWNGFAARSLKIIGIDFETVTEGGFAYWRVTYTIEHNPDSWWFTYVLSSGWNVKVPDPSGPPGTLRKVPATSVFGDRLASPVLLAVNGEVLDPGDAPVYVPFRFVEEISFSMV